MNAPRLQKLALLLVATATTLIVGELAARVVFRDTTTTADNRSYFALEWKRTHVRLNRLGFREREIEPKLAGAYRVAFIGDSFAFGQGIDESERMSNLLEGALRKRAPNVDVLNFGNPGNNTADEVAVLQEVLATAHPDFVLLQWFVNDVENKGPAGGDQSSLEPEPSSVNRFKQWMRNTSVVYFLVAEAWHRVLDSVGMSYADELFRRVGDPESADSLAADAALTTFIDTCRSRHVGVSVVLVPSLVGLKNGKNYPFSYLHERVLSRCAREGIQCLDLLDTFRPYLSRPDYQRLWVNRFDSHMGRLANRLAAERLVDLVQPLVLGSEPSSARHAVVTAREAVNVVAGSERRR